MRKLALFAAFAAALGGAAGLHAQTPAQTPSDTTHRAHEGRGGRFGRGGPAMMDQMLLKNITLTDAQKTQLESVRKTERSAMQKDGARRGDFEALRKARESGDTATVRKLMAEQRTQMEARLTAHASAIRAILTPDQRKQLDANVAELKSHPMQFGRGGRGGQWHAQRPAV